MANFSLDTKGRAWCVTVQIENMKKMNLTEEQYKNPDFLCDYLMSLWHESGAGRKSACAVCESADGLYHAHMALYGNTTTLRCVAKTLFDSHTEPQMGGKKSLSKYLKKEPPYDEKGETVLTIKGLENIEDAADIKPSLERAQEYINQGLTPSEIFSLSLYYRKYERAIKEAYIDKRIKEMPVYKDMCVEWHCGDSGTGKSYHYMQLCEEYGAENIYFCTDLENGGLDLYLDNGAPPILFIDEYKGQLPYYKLLQLTDRYSRAQTHCRYGNTYNLWTTVIITSIFPPDEIYATLVDRDKRGRDTLQQLLRRINKIVYHYKEGTEYKTYSIPGIEYVDFYTLKARAKGDSDGFLHVENEVTPFDT